MERRVLDLIFHKRDISSVVRLYIDFSRASPKMDSDPALRTHDWKCVILPRSSNDYDCCCIIICLL